jgi:hypothetical protein
MQPLFACSAFCSGNCSEQFYTDTTQSSDLSLQGFGKSRADHSFEAYREFNCAVRAMTPIQQCLQSLAVLAKTDDLNGISLAESKIDEFVRTAGTESAWQIVALDDLKHEITDRGWGTPCFGHILDYIARQRAAIAAKCEPLNDRPPQIAPAFTQNSRWQALRKP